MGCIAYVVVILSLTGILGSATINPCSSRVSARLYIDDWVHHVEGDLNRKGTIWIIEPNDKIGEYRVIGAIE
jgi:hypothetical protein